MTDFHEPQGIDHESRLLSRADQTAIEAALSVLSPRWTAAVLLELVQGKKRTIELLKALPGLSAKTLSERLHTLQRLGLVTRTVFPEVPPRVVYELECDGKPLVEALLTLKAFGRGCITDGKNGDAQD